jgi:carbon monoxide dehydrogenase subunit G
MMVVGEVAARGSAQAVWDALHDAAVLARAIPGCEQLEASGPGAGQFIATTALPAIGGTYAGKLIILDEQRPSLLSLTASATGDQGTITADVTLRFGQTDGAGATTLVRYEANGTVTGPIASVGSRLLASAAKRLAGEFFAVIDECVTAPAVSSPADAAATEPAPAAPTTPGTVARPDRLADNRVALVAGAAIGLAGVIIGVLAGRRGRRAGRVRG